MSGDADVSKTQVQSNPNYSRTFARSFKKRFFQNKQTSNNNTSSFLDKIMTTQNEKRFHVAQLKSQIEMVLKQQENLIKRNIKIHQITDMFSDINGKPKAKSNKSELPNSKPQPDDNDKEQSFDKGLRSLKMSNTLVVIRGLVSLLLAMDYTCNMDLFLLTCKILARLVSACQPAVQLSKIITMPQLQQLVRLAVWREQQPWAVHAITCLLQDILDADRNFNFKLIDCCDDDDDEDIVTADPTEMEVVPDAADVAGASENDRKFYKLFAFAFHD